MLSLFANRPHRLVASVALVLAVACGCYWGRQGLPQQIASAPGGKIACVSYAPYRKNGETPWDPSVRVSAARIEEDLAALSRRFSCIRTYSVGAGLDQVPGIARAHHMTVYLGIWLSRNELDNRKEIDLGIDVARRNRDVINAVIVGNEVLLRGELSQTALAAHIRAVRDATGLPVTYADVWEFWLKYREVAPAVSFITIHILPYWEDQPVPVDEAVEHVRKILAQMQAAFPDKDFLIGETGWPSAGRQRRGAVPSLTNEARFTREFLSWAQQSGARYNVIEAFDQPWKRQLEGTVGGYWGMYDDDLDEKFPLTGPVVENAGWFYGWFAGAFAALIFMVLSFRYVRGGLIVSTLTGFACGSLLYAEWHHLPYANRNMLEWSLTSILMGLSAITSVAANLALVRQLARPEPSDACASIASALAYPWRVMSALALLRFLWMFVASVMDVSARIRRPLSRFSDASGGAGRPGVRAYGAHSEFRKCRIH